MTEADNRVTLDLNNADFQESLFNLGKEEQTSVLGTLRKITALTRNQVYKDPGLQWELIRSRTGLDGERQYSFRISKSFRGVAYRDGALMRILGLFPDHDSACRT